MKYVLKRCLRQKNKKCLHYAYHTGSAARHYRHKCYLKTADLKEVVRKNLRKVIWLKQTAPLQ